MGSRKLTLLLAFLLQIVSLVAAGATSYASIKTEKYQDSNSVSDLISQATENDPIVVFRFSRYPLLEALLPYEGRVPYLTSFFETDMTKSYPKEVSTDIMENKDEIETFEIDELTLTASQLLYNKPIEGKSVVVFNFQDSYYDLPILDEFMESAYLLLHNSFSRVENIVLSVADATASDRFSTAGKTKKAHVSQEPKKPANDDDKDILSTIWTEGLIMCLIVSLLLLGILIVAISWMSSVDISYGALEKSANPLKKTK
ncbi:Voa1p TDEL_0F03330 [Torulaspora delbrueckii]|uniref:V-type proton ATPase subunit S1/VOA1 transmembrane domain-containing protein n=1 Tax=Torulaspora delbrueckii TaxID=4950 RepID=G8ZX00_TORDE|nr:hypothetical protein TDEL_0F03330 [Torulaspora delbrueckii]CCE93144.1 hypothetical protein TDEL_0F03330 [Torulaspora delbrueckii]